MSNQPDISIVISTYNRCALLPIALDSVLAQKAFGVNYEIVVVDNNSTDETKRVVESYVQRGASNLRYVFEGNQGIAHGRNAGIVNARAPIIAYTDDDVHVAPDWIANIKRAFDEHPKADFVGGKVLARWEKEPPRWLTREQWSPLAVLDYGNELFYVNLDKQLCLITANAAFRREALERVGHFNARFQPLGEDHELELRIWQAGGQGLYDPRIVVTTDVQAERMTKKYHRAWHKKHGRLFAKLRLPETEESKAGRFFDVPAHLYKQAVLDAAIWLKHTLRGARDEAFKNETRLHFFAGFLKERRREFLHAGNQSSAREIASFLQSLASTKNRRRAPKEIN